MDDFNPGDRVIICDGSDLQGRIAVVSDDSVKIFKPGKGIVYVKLGPFHVPFSDNDLRPAFQTCKDCAGDGGIHKWGGLFVCRTCDGDGYKYRTGPYRLADGTWSDGVDRSEPMGEREVAMRRWEVWRDRGDTGEWTAGFDPDAWVGASEKNFPTHAEAIAYADKQARTANQGEN